MPKKTISEKTTPILKKTAALNPLLTLISKIVKKTGPMVKDSITPKKLQVKNQSLFLISVMFPPRDIV